MLLLLNPLQSYLELWPIVKMFNESSTLISLTLHAVLCVLNVLKLNKGSEQYTDEVN